MAEKRNTHRVLVGRPRRNWEDKTGVDFTEIGWDGVDWIYLAQDMNKGRVLC
jgi:hypothetical protein